MDLPTSSGDALAQPTRSRLFALLVELRRPADTAELAARLELHPNGVRRHLERLHEAGLVEREREGGGERGRPADRWRVAPTAHPGGEHPQGYRDLAVWLAAAAATSGRGLRELERAGREIGRQLAPPDAGQPGPAFEATLAALGFEPELSAGADGRLCCRLGNCPYREAVERNPEAVCGMHRGITAGLLEALDPAARLAAFEPREPDRAGCLVEVDGGWEVATLAQ